MRTLAASNGVQSKRSPRNVYRPHDRAHDPRRLVDVAILSMDRPHEQPQRRLDRGNCRSARKHAANHVRRADAGSQIPGRRGARATLDRTRNSAQSDVETTGLERALPCPVRFRHSLRAVCHTRNAVIAAEPIALMGSTMFMRTLAASNGAIEKEPTYENHDKASNHHRGPARPHGRGAGWLDHRNGTETQSRAGPSTLSRRDGGDRHLRSHAVPPYGILVHVHPSGGDVLV